MAKSIVVKGETVEWDTIGELLDTRGRENRDELAMEVCGRKFTYGEIVDHSNRVAANLHRLGVRKGDHVASLLPNSLEQILTWFGCMKIGAVWLPINIGLLGDDLTHTLTDGAPRILVIAHQFSSRLDSLSVAKTLQKVIVGGRKGGYLNFEELLTAGGPPEVAIGPGDAAVIMYTGGTTGLPKGAVLPHFAWIAAGYRYRETFHIRPDDRHYSVLPLFHNGGLQLGVLGPILCKIPSTIEPKFSLSNYWRRIQETGSTVIDMIGTIMVLLTQAEECAEEKNNSVRVCLAPILQLPSHIPTTFAKRFDIKLINVYSLSEGGGTVIIHGEPGSAKPLSNGNGNGWADIQIVDEHDIPVSAGATGQICLRPRYPHIFMKGYLNNPKKTAETFANLWLHTGDLGHVDEDGDLYFTGRQVHWMRRRGENVSAYEVESVIGQYAGVKEVVAVGVPAELGEEEVKVFVVANEGTTLDPAALHQWCGSRIASFKVPRYIELIDAFPRSTSKLEVERHKLKAMSNQKAWDAEFSKGSMSKDQAARRADQND